MDHCPRALDLRAWTIDKSVEYNLVYVSIVCSGKIIKNQSLFNSSVIML